MKIEMVVSGARKPLVVDENMTIAALQDLVSTEWRIGAKGGEVHMIVRAGSGKPITAGTLADNGVRDNDRLEAKVRLAGGPDTYTPAVKAQLINDLEALRQGNDCLLVFVGLGSCDQGHPEETIRRQQCPPAFREVGTQHGMSLRVLLVDKGFATVPTPQIYDIDRSWQKVSSASEDNVVRRYRHGSDELWVYPTHLDSQDGSLLEAQPADWDDPERPCQLAGQDVNAIAGAIHERGGLLVLGNFFHETARPVYAAGDQAALSELRSRMGW